MAYECLGNWKRGQCSDWNVWFYLQRLEAQLNDITELHQHAVRTTLCPWDTSCYGHALLFALIGGQSAHAIISNRTHHHKQMSGF